MSSATESKEAVTGASKLVRSVYWEGELDGKLYMIDQRILPGQFEIIGFDTVEAVAEAIKDMLVRGAPAIGAAGGFGMAIAAHKSQAADAEALVADLKVAKKMLDDARPTAVNLSWATARLVDLASLMAKENQTVAHIKKHILLEAQELADDDVRINQRLGNYGAEIVPEGANILHHCNTGRLATVDYGTALGVVYSCQEQGKKIHVWVDETRPRLQGARLTAWELMRAGVDMHLIPDNAAGHLMYEGKVDVILFGADRVAANGDVANKIGTYKLGVCGHENGIPVYACVPTSTIDLTLASGREIVIENRHESEVTEVGSERIAPVNCPVYNPAFDVTPFKYLTGIITEEGICYPPFKQSLTLAKQRAEKRIQEAWSQRLEKHLH